MIIHGNALVLPLADQSVQCVVTSPPYWALRDYGYAGQLGQEESPEAYVENLVSVFREVWRVLRDDGTLWLNLGDSYASSGKNRTRAQACAKSGLSGSLESQARFLQQRSKIVSGLKTKDLVGIPWRVAFALQADGWILRSEVIWHKPNSMPSSVKDRPSSSHETIFLLAKRPKYYYDHDSVKVEAKSTELRRFVDKDGDKQRGHSRPHAGFNGRYADKVKKEGVPKRRNLRDVWTVAPANFAEAHFATFPEALIKPCIMAGAPEGGIVFDPFVGSGTTVKVAQDLGRVGVGLEMGAKYLPMARRRTAQGVLC